MARTDAEILGRDSVDDLDAILAVTNTEVDEAVHAVKDNADAIFTWDYERTRPALGKLYEKAKTSQWNGETDLPVGHRRSTPSTTSPPAPSPPRSPASPR